MKQKKENLSIRIPVELNKQFTEYVAQLGMTKNAFIINLIHKELKKKNSLIKDNKDS